MSSSPGETTPVTSTESYCGNPAVTQATCLAGPPALSREIMRISRGRLGAEKDKMLFLQVRRGKPDLRPNDPLPMGSHVPRGIARVHHQASLVHDPRPVICRMIRHDQHAVLRPQVL